MRRPRRLRPRRRRQRRRKPGRRSPGTVRSDGAGATIAMASGTRETFPAQLAPMMAQLASAPFRDPAWLFEPKLDGYRMLAFVHGGELTLVSRRGIAYTRLFPSIV